MSENPDECQICGARDFELLDGMYFCKGCQSQSQFMREVTNDEFREEVVFGAMGEIGKVRTRKKRRGKTTDIVSLDRLVLYEVYTFVLKLQTKALIDIGVSDKLEVFRKIQKLDLKNGKMDVKTPELMNQFPIVENEIFENAPKDVDALPGEHCIAVGDLRKRGDVFTKEKLKLSLTIYICYLALIDIGANVYLSDLMRLMASDYLPFFNIYPLLPTEFQSAPFKRHFNLMTRYTSRFLTRMYHHCVEFAGRIKFNSAILVDFSEMLARFVINLNLPGCFIPRVVSLYKRVSDHISMDFLDANVLRVLRPCFQSVPPDTKVLAFIIIALKLTFGLDDHCEFVLSNIALDRGNGREDVSNFVFLFWFSQLKLRASVLNGSSVEQVLTKEWHDSSELTISKIIDTIHPEVRRWWLRRKIILNEDVENIFGQEHKMCNVDPTTLGSLFPLRCIVDRCDVEPSNANVDPNLLEIFKHDHFGRDSLEFLSTLSTDDETALLAVSKPVDDILTEPPVSRNKTFIRAPDVCDKLFPCGRRYQTYPKFMLTHTCDPLRFAHLGQTQFSKTFDDLLSLLGELYFTPTMLLFYTVQRVEELLTFYSHLKRKPKKGAVGCQNDGQTDVI